jgi:hypothetical protein
MDSLHQHTRVKSYGVAAITHYTTTPESTLDKSNGIVAIAIEASLPQSLSRFFSVKYSLRVNETKSETVAETRRYITMI